MSDQAKADLKAIHEYIARDSTHYARKVARDSGREPVREWLKGLDQPSR